MGLLITDGTVRFRGPLKRAKVGQTSFSDYPNETQVGDEKIIFDLRGDLVVRRSWEDLEAYEPALEFPVSTKNGNIKVFLTDVFFMPWDLANPLNTVGNCLVCGSRQQSISLDSPKCGLAG